MQQIKGCALAVVCGRLSKPWNSIKLFFVALMYGRSHCFGGVSENL